MATQTPKRILIAPLDWGLGHTARCVPLIRYILSLGHIPVVACNASQRSFIEETFGAIDIIHLKGYDVTYSKWNRFGQIGLLSQLPRINKCIQDEYKWLQEQAKVLKLDGIISDNRYGLFHQVIPSVIMTHQLQVQTGFGNVADRVIQKIHYKYLNLFGAAWVVDTPTVPNLGGKLSHPERLPHNVNYIGLLSQFEGLATAHLNPEPGTLFILLSGPEPQRTVLSKILWQQVQKYNGNVIFIDGSDKAIAPKTIPPHITYHKRLTNKSLAPLLQSAGTVVCRSGYSTIMDLAVLNKKAILIPTPGQTEQEYLGKYLHEQGVFYCAKQDGFDLNKAMNETAGFRYKPAMPEDAYLVYKEKLVEWLSTL